jgi:hypothetical protein
MKTVTHTSKLVLLECVVYEGVHPETWDWQDICFKSGTVLLPSESIKVIDHRAVNQSHPWRSDPQSDAQVRADEDREAAKKPPEILHRDLPDVVASLLKRVAELENKERFDFPTSDK